MKPIDELTFIDDYMFGEVMKNKEICKGVLERLTRLKIRDIEYPELQKSLKAGYESHGVRLDVYVRDSDKVYDIEIQNKHYVDLGKRTRFYQSLIDADCLIRGTDYKKLPESMIIFICKDDPFGRGLQKYSFRTVCAESDSVEFNDKCQKLIYNASAWEQEEDAGMRAFLQFVSRNEASDDLTDGLLESVAEVKRNEIFRKEYLSMGVWESDIRDAALQEGEEKGRQEGYSRGVEYGLAKGQGQKAIEDALILVRDFNVPPETAAEKMGAQLDAVLAAL